MSEYTPEEKKRVGNTDRDRYIDQLAAAISTGHISEEEFGERRDKALVATIKKDLIILVADLPDLPKPKRTLVTYQLAGCSWHFSPVRWGAALIISSALLVLPGPLCAAAWHGFDNAPGGGLLPISLILLGVTCLLGFGIGWAPDDKKREECKSDV